LTLDLAHTLEVSDALVAVRHTSAAAFDAIAVRVGCDQHAPISCHIT
jgi:hypothetical protein